LLRRGPGEGSNGQAHLAAVAVHYEGFLPADWVARKGPVGEAGAVWFVYDLRNLHWFHDSHAEEVCRDSHTVTW